MEDNNIDILNDSIRISELNKEVMAVIVDKEPHIAIGSIALAAAMLIKTYEDLGREGAMDAFIDLLKDFKGKIDFIIGNGQQGDN